MKKFLSQMFYVPKYGKMEESAFMMRIAGSVAIILLCLAAMSFAGYAYFSSSVTSGINVIQAACFTLNVNDAPLVDRYLLTGGENEFKLAWSERTTASVGYGKILVYNNEGEEIHALYTQPFTSESDTCTITFSVPDGAQFTVRVIAEWGSCALRVEAVDGTTVDLSPFVPPVEEDQEPVLEDTDDSGNEIPDEKEDDAESDDIPEETDDLITGEGAGEATETQPEDSSEVNSEEDLDTGDTDILEENTSFGETQPEEETQTDSSEVPDAPTDEQTEKTVQESAEEMNPEAFDSVPGT